MRAAQSEACCSSLDLSEAREPWKLGTLEGNGFWSASSVTREHEELTSQILGEAIEVHRTLGPAF